MGLTNLQTSLDKRPTLIVEVDYAWTALLPALVNVMTGRGVRELRQAVAGMAFATRLGDGSVLEGLVEPGPIAFLKERWHRTRRTYLVGFTVDPALPRFTDLSGVTWSKSRAKEWSSRLEAALTLIHVTFGADISIPSPLRPTAVRRIQACPRGLVWLPREHEGRFSCLCGGGQCRSHPRAEGSAV